MSSIAGAVYTSVSAMSADGRVMVGSCQESAASPIRPCRWIEESGWEWLPGEAGEARGVDSGGSVVVGFRGTFGARTPMKWTGTAPAELAAPGSNCAALAASRDGEIIVGECFDPSFGNPKAVIWEGNQAHFLLDRVVEIGRAPLASVSTMESASAISEDGVVIAGTIQTNAGQPRGFVLMLNR